MINKTDIIKAAKHIFKRSQHIPDRRLMHPRREWSLLLLTSFVLLVVGAVFSAERFVYYLHLEDNLAENPQTVITYQVGTLNRSLQYYQSRSEVFTGLASTAAAARDLESFSVPEVTTDVEVVASSTAAAVSATTSSSTVLEQ